MKNKEKYFDEIVDTLASGTFCDFIKSNVKPCGGLTCTECREHFKAWLEENYKGLTEVERVILANLDDSYKWLARDEDNMLMVYTDKPFKDNEYDEWANNGSNENFPFSHLFEFVKWSDEEPYSIKELLNDK